MSTWRSGEFERQSVSRLFRAFTPARAIDNLHSVDVDALWSGGKRLILLDVDNTLVAWKKEDFSPEIRAWLARAKALGFQICIISNTHRLERLARIKTELGVETVRGRFKPSRAMFRLALIKFGRKAEETVMIGDQMMTDILGANRSGIDAIWVRQMDAREFGPTKVNRFIERLLTSAIYKALVMPESETAHGVPAQQAAEVTVVQQIVRFLVVGGASFLIDTVLTVFLMHWIKIGGEEMGSAFGRSLQLNLPHLFAFADTPDKASAPVLGAVASFVAMFNSFFWNRLWTFEAKGKDRKSAQVVRFYIVSILGVLLNAAIFTFFYNNLPGRRILFSKMLAAAIVAIWSFLGQRFFAFKAARPA
jgi:HAD superfamily phosphatase (TIGR01668 family)